MTPNLEKRFIRLAVQQSAYRVAHSAFQSRFHLLFDALAQDLGLNRNELARRLGWEPVPEGGNSIMRGEADPSEIDVARLLEVYLETRK